MTESRPCTTNLDIYVPLDERVSPKKKSEFISNSIQGALHFLILEGKGSKHLESFDEIDAMFSANESLVIEGSLKEKLKAMVPDEFYKTHAIKKTLKFPLPQIIAGDTS